MAQHASSPIPLRPRTDGSRKFIEDYLASLSDLLLRLPSEAIAEALDVLGQAHAQGRTVFLIGNGGSASTAQHLANDLMAGVAKDAAHGFRAVCLCSNTAVMTCLANDYGFDQVFARQLRELARPGDVLLAISGSGNSPNILLALEEARRLGMQSVGMLARDGGAALKLSDLSIVVPAEDYAPIEDAHMALSHLIATYFRKVAAGR